LRPPRSQFPFLKVDKIVGWKADLPPH
jgi:hypothetical protein